MNHLYPMKISYVTKAPIWGGTRLLSPETWGKIAKTPTVGESWELTVRENEMSVILNGDLAGMTLGLYVKSYGRACIGKDYDKDEFPLLIKLIDATDKLSVQVHPDDAYAARVENGRGKTEMWYVVDADAGAEIVYGLSDGVDRDAFQEAVKNGKVESVLKYEKVHAGETYFIPAGLVHAIGAGVLIAEIQQNCDLTYRIYDYDRRLPDGSPRELHIEKALDVVKPFTEEEIRSIRFRGGIRESEDELARCEYFRTCLSHPDRENGERTFDVNSDSFLYVLCLGGEGELIGGGVGCPIRQGDSFFIPAGTGCVKLTGSAELITARLG